MTIIGNIFFPGTAGLPGLATGVDVAAGQQGLPQGLAGLFGFALGEAGAAPMPSLTTDLSAKLAALLQNPSATGQDGTLKSLLSLLQPEGQEKISTQELAAKLAALLQKPAEKPATPLQTILNALQPEKADAKAADPVLEKIAALLQSLPEPQKPIRPALTSDLTSASAPVLQDTATDDAPLFTDEQLANLLSNLEPGVDAAPLDRHVLIELKTKIDTGAIKPENVISFLKTKGFDDAVTQKYVAALEKVMTGQATIESIVPEPQETALPGTMPQKEKASSAEAPDKRAQAHPAQASPEAPVQPRKAETPAQKTPAPAHPSAVNVLAAQGAGADTGTVATATSAAAQGTDGIFVSASQGGGHGSIVNTLAPAQGAAHAQATTQMVAIQLQANAARKIDTMTIALEPANLGRLDIRMKFGKDGTVKAHLSVDKPETLAMLQKDAAHLQRALQQAGFDTEDASLSFDLRQDAQHQQQANHAEDQRQGRGGYRHYANEMESAALAAQIAVQAYGHVSQSGVNIMV